MAKNLVIVESPAKAKTINRILGASFVVKPSMGHVRDLPVKSLSVSIEKEFKPTYTVVPGRKKIVDELKKSAADCENIYLAPDPDREGESIAWHLQHLLKKKDGKQKFLRITYNEITPSAVKKAIASPREIDQRLVDAQQARRVLDRIVGYMVSPVLWRRIQRGLSAGRVQSVALRLVCERENEIRSFVPEAFWIIGARVRKQVPPPDTFHVKLTHVNGEKAEVKAEERATDLLADLKGQALRVAQINDREIQRRAPPPFITSTLQQAGSSFCGYSPSRTMSIAQQLYEGVNLGDGPVGLITYMRTDSFTVAAEAISACRSMIGDKYGSEYVPEKPNFFRNKRSAQEAHEAIRPTDVTRTPESLEHVLDRQQMNLYTLIWKRFVASQMSPARVNQRSVIVEAKGISGTNAYNFRASASEVIFAGYMKVAGTDMKIRDAETKDEGGEEDAQTLPPLEVGETLDVIEWLSERKQTQPPPRYSEASLVKVLESNGVGRPSTYAQIISTLINRKYVVLDRRMLVPTELGMKVCALLVELLSDLFDVKFTAMLEEELDEIEEGKIEWTAMMKDFYGRFQEWMIRTREPGANPDHVRKVLSLMDRVQEWRPSESGRGKFSDTKFVSSIRKQLDDTRKEVTARQFEALVAVALKYQDVAPETVNVLRELGYGALIDRPENREPDATTMRRLEVAGKLSLGDSALKFTESLRQRVGRGRGLTEAQTRALNSILVGHAAMIPNYEAERQSLGLPSEAEIPRDNESGPLLAALAGVKTWKPAVKRGKRTFDDHVFVESLERQYRQKGALSDKQRNVLKRFVSRYRDQIPDYEKLAAALGLKSATERKATDARASADN